MGQDPFQTSVKCARKMTEQLRFVKSGCVEMMNAFIGTSFILTISAISSPVKVHLRKQVELAKRLKASLQYGCNLGFELAGKKGTGRLYRNRSIYV